MLKEQARARNPEAERVDKSKQAESRDRRVDGFLAYQAAKEDGYQGSEAEFMERFLAEENRRLIEDFRRKAEESATEDDRRVVPRGEGAGHVIPASIACARGERHFTVVEADGQRVMSVEHLLAALEACGVDNCRIEIEGPEVPVVDGSAAGWTTLVVRTGVVECADRVRKGVIRIEEPLVVTGEGGAFITVAPSPTPVVSCGWDGMPMGAPVIGRQWFTWDVENDYHFL